MANILEISLFLAGALLALYAAVLETKAFRRPSSSHKALAIVSGFRVAVVGLCMSGIGAGLFWEIGWLWMLSLIIGGEELLESSVIIMALRDQQRIDNREPKPQGI